MIIATTTTSTTIDVSYWTHQVANSASWEEDNLQTLEELEAYFTRKRDKLRAKHTEQIAAVHNPLWLMDSMVLSWYRCSYKKEHDDDEQEFIDDMHVQEEALEKEGWIGICISDCSPKELRAMRRWTKRHSDRAWMGRGEYCDEDLWGIGRIEDLAYSMMFRDEVMLTAFAKFVKKFHRPCLAMTKRPITEEVTNFLAPLNHRIVTGSHATAITFEAIPEDHYKKLLALLV